MGINVISHKRADKTVESMDIQIDGYPSVRAFRELVQRATNLWPDAPPAIKEFADLVIHGEVLQDYSRAHVTQQPKFCSYLTAACPSGCKGRSCKIQSEAKAPAPKEQAP